MSASSFTVGDTTVSTPSDTEVRMQRVFKAPRAFVWDCFTKPELLKRWFVCRGYALSVCEVDFRVGGYWRYVLTHPERPQMGMGGEYLEIQAPERSVHTEAFDDFPGQATVTGEWHERDGVTEFTGTVRYPSKEVRDAVLASGMADGASECYDNLARVLAETVQA